MTFNPFSVPIIASFQVAQHRPERAIVCHNGSGAYQFYAWHIADGTLRQLTHNPHGATVGTISADGERVYYLEDAQGGGIGHFFCVNWDGTGAHDITPNIPAYLSYYINESMDGRVLSFMVYNQDGAQVFVRPVGSQEVFIHFQSTGVLLGGFLSYKGEICVVATNDHNTSALDFRLEAYTVRDAQRLRALTESDAFPIGFARTQENVRFIATTPTAQGERPLVWIPVSGEQYTLAYPRKQGDIKPLDWSQDGWHLLIAHEWQARQTLLVQPMKVSVPPARLLSPSGYVTQTHMNANNTIYALWQGAHTPPRVVLLNNEDGGLAQVALALGDTVPDLPTPVSLSTQHAGFTVQAWHYPAMHPDAPIVVSVASTPYDVVREGYHAAAVFWQLAGFAHVIVNARGSLSFGRAYEDALDGAAGVGDVADMLAVLETHFDGRKLAIVGAGYGGFVALRALAAAPERFFAGAVIDPITDWHAVYQELEATSQALVRRLLGKLPTPDDTLTAQVGALRVPLFVGWGDSYPFISEATITRYVQALAAQGKPHETHRYQGDPSALYPLMRAFFQRHLSERA